MGSSSLSRDGTRAACVRQHRVLATGPLWKSLEPMLLTNAFLFTQKGKVAQSCPTLCDPRDYTVRGILQARTLTWLSFPFSRGSSQPRDQTLGNHIAGRLFTLWATRKPKKDLHNSEDHNGVITHLEPDILQCGQMGLRKHHYKQN